MLETHRFPRAIVIVAALAACAGMAGCRKRPAPPPVVRSWVVGVTAPAFDPHGPPDPTRWAIERLLSRGLVEEDSSGALVLAAAEYHTVTPDSLVHTFRLRPDLRYTDGRTCTSRDFRLAIEGGLNREDHATDAWLLGALKGMDQVRAGRPLPPLGIETPDARTLVLRLARPDPQLLRKLAVPGACVPWRETVPDSGDWKRAIGLGPYRVIAELPGRALTLARADTSGPNAARPDTVHVRFVVGASRALWLMRNTRVDLLWPVPPGLRDADLPPGHHAVERAARPPRRLMLVMRADLPPMTRLPARHALAHALNRGELLAALGSAGGELDRWIPGAGPFEFPALDAGVVSDWLARGNLGRSFHVVMAYDADGAGAEVARAMQGDWARLNLYADLRPLRGEKFAEECLAGTAHLLLVEAQPLTNDPAAELAALALPMRGPAVGAFRTGWRTREFDAFAAPRRGAPPPDPTQAQQRLEEERVVLPIASLPWRWVERDGASPAAFHPHFGPECVGPALERVEFPVNR